MEGREEIVVHRILEAIWFNLPLSVEGGSYKNNVYNTVMCWISTLADLTSLFCNKYL